MKKNVMSRGDRRAALARRRVILKRYEPKVTDSPAAKDQAGKK